MIHRYAAFSLSLCVIHNAYAMEDIDKKVLQLCIGEYGLENLQRSLKNKPRIAAAVMYEWPIIKKKKHLSTEIEELNTAVQHLLGCPEQLTAQTMYRGCYAGSLPDSTREYFVIDFTQDDLNQLIQK